MGIVTGLKPMIRCAVCGLLLLALFYCRFVHADIGRVYHPYVELSEREIEYGLTSRDQKNGRLLLQRAGFGYAWTDRFFGEMYILTESLTDDDQQIAGYEAELKWQLTEQGEYWADWGLLVEMATAKDSNAHEFAVGLLWEKEITNRWVSTVNTLLEYEYGDDIDNELEMALRAQVRYRSSRLFEPALELYLDDQDQAFGPGLLGAKNFSAGKKLLWEIGLLFGLDQGTPKNNIRFSLEFEF